MRLFNSALLSLPLGRARHRPDEERRLGKIRGADSMTFKGERFDVPGLSIDLSHIQPPRRKPWPTAPPCVTRRSRLERSSSN